MHTVAQSFKWVQLETEKWHVIIEIVCSFCKRARRIILSTTQHFYRTANACTVLLEKNLPFHIRRNSFFLLRILCNNFIKKNEYFKFSISHSKQLFLLRILCNNKKKMKISWLGVKEIVICGKIIKKKKVLGFIKLKKYRLLIYRYQIVILLINLL